MRSRDELSRFLKRARSRIRPEDVGLPAGERRRAKGLRREEVAALAGMSVTWYTWFEQGRDVKLSAAMLERLSGAFRLTGEERAFLFALAQHRPPPLAPVVDDRVTPTIQHVLDALPVPAQVLSDDWTVVAWNRAAALVFRDYSRLAERDRNLLKLLVLPGRDAAEDDGYRDRVGRLTARLRWDYSRSARPEVLDPLIDEMLAKSRVFADYWEKMEIAAHFEGVHAIDFPALGKINFRHASFAIEQTPTQRLIVFAPVDTDDAERLRRLIDAADSPD
jgi:transcriptional regulator with XRE-family HTH domain